MFFLFLSFFILRTGQRGKRKGCAMINHNHNEDTSRFKHLQVRFDLFSVSVKVLSCPKTKYLRSKGDGSRMVVPKTN